MHTLLYGGTFDPLHHGHLITCQRARELLAADRVTLIPARISPHKTQGQPASSADHRLAMIQLAIAGLSQFAVDPRELDRPGPSYTIDTLEEIQREQPTEKLTLLLGADQLPKFPTWHRITDLLAMNLNIAILLRSPRNPADPLTADLEVGLLAIENRLGPAARERISRSLLNTPRIDISATDIRDRVRRGLPIDFLLPPTVADYIRQHNLYRT